MLSMDGRQFPYHDLWDCFLHVHSWPSLAQYIPRKYIDASSILARHKIVIVFSHLFIWGEAVRECPT